MRFTFARKPMTPGQDVAICFAAIFFGLAVWREIIWFRRFSTWKRAAGRVMGFRTEGDGPNGPTVMYSVEGRDKTFDSSFCLSNPQLGADVDVLFDPETENAVILTRRHRWFLTGLCGCLFVVMVIIAALTH
jgi:hypothetical protein